MADTTATKIEVRIRPWWPKECFASSCWGARRVKRACWKAAAYVGANLPNARQKDFYFWYYGCLALYQHKGPEWEKWNPRIQEVLVGLTGQEGESGW